ncbi:unnamed protein product [Ectocarpus sp. 4 AP-2014]
MLYISILQIDRDDRSCDRSCSPENPYHCERKVTGDDSLLAAPTSLHVGTAAAAEVTQSPPSSWTQRKLLSFGSTKQTNGIQRRLSALCGMSCWPSRTPRQTNSPTPRLLQPGR